MTNNRAAQRLARRQAFFVASLDNESEELQAELETLDYCCSTQQQEGKWDPASLALSRERLVQQKPQYAFRASAVLANAMERRSGQLEKDVDEAHKEIREIFNRGS